MLLLPWKGFANFAISVVVTIGSFAFRVSRIYIKLFDDERVLAIPKFIAVDKFGLSFWIEIN